MTDKSCPLSEYETHSQDRAFDPENRRKANRSENNGREADVVETKQ